MSGGTLCKELHARHKTGLAHETSGPARGANSRTLANSSLVMQREARPRRKQPHARSARWKLASDTKKRPALDGPPYQPTATPRAIDENLVLNRLVENPVKFPIKLGDVLDLELIRKPAASHHV